jgi:RNA polymerase sigma-70 factor, ECF subfamily
MPSPSALTEDAKLLFHIAEGNIDAFQFFYDRYAARVTSYVRQLTRDREAVEDTVQEIFLNVWRKAASYKADRGDVPGWLYTMTRNRLVDQWRRKGAGAEVDGFELSDLPEEPKPSDDLLLSVRQALDHVAPDQREAIEMAYFGGLTYEETAHKLELPVGTLKSRIRSGLRSMRSVLEAR